MAHVEAAVRVKPKFSRAVPVQFDPILIGIAEIQGFAHSMGNRSVDRDPGRFQAPEGVAQPAPLCVHDSEMEKPGRVLRRRRAVAALPRIDAYIVVVAFVGEERGLVSDALRHFESEDALIERKRAFQIKRAPRKIAPTGDR